jgi:hypothetical protein
MGVLIGVSMMVTTAVFAAAGIASVPQKINYQGRLVDSDTGEPITGEHNMTFQIFNAEVGGTGLWAENFGVTADTAGVISVILGNLTPIDLTDEDTLWLQVEIGGEVLEPRRELVSVPFALRAASSEYAANADSLGGMAADSYVRDGHSLDADDGDPEDVVYVDQYGKVGVGTTTPYADFHIRKDANDAVRFSIENPDGGNSASQRLIFDDGVQLAGVEAFNAADPEYPNELVIFNNRSEAKIRLTTSSYGFMMIDPDGRVGIKNDTPAHELDVNGQVKADFLILGDDTQDGYLSINRGGNGFPVVQMRDLDDDGGMLWLREDGGQIHTSLEPDIDTGGGGWMQIRSSTGTPGITMDGNFAGTEMPRLTISSSVATASFQMNHTGDASVNLPVDAIASDEIFDEPGVASDKAYYVPGGIALGAGFTTLATRSIYAPGPGFILVIGSAQPTYSHTLGTNTQAEFGVSDGSGSFPDNQDCLLMVPSSAATGIYTFPVTVHRLFSAPAEGDYTYWFLANKFSGTVTGNDVQLTLIYFPTNYGTVETLSEGGGGAMSVESEGVVVAREQQVAPEPMTAESVYRARIEAELAAMKAEIEALRLELEADPNRERNRDVTKPVE